jgi:hypothetical protein
MYRVCVIHVDDDRNFSTLHNVVLRAVDVRIVVASVMCGGVSISQPSADMAASMLHDIQALQDKQIPPALEEKLLYPAFQRVLLVILPFDSSSRCSMVGHLAVSPSLF